MSKCTQDSQNIYTKLLSLPDNAKKPQFLVPQLKKKFAPAPRLHLQSDHIINIHTKQEKLYIWICPGTISIPVYRTKHTFDLKNSNFCCAGFQNNSTHLHSNKQKLSPVSENLTDPLQTCVCFFTLTSRKLCPQTYSLSLPLEWSQVTHTPASQRATKYFYCFFFNFFKVPPSHMKVPPDHYKRPQATSKRHAPLLFPVLPWESVNKPMNSNHAIMVTQLFMSRIGPICALRQSYLKAINICHLFTSFHSLFLTSCRPFPRFLCIVFWAKPQWFHFPPFLCFWQVFYFCSLGKYFCLMFLSCVSFWLFRTAFDVRILLVKIFIIFLIK